MIIVSNLIRSVFVVLCFSMIVMELVAFFFLIFFFKEGIYKNNSNIEEQLNQMTKDILYSYNTLFTEAFTNIQTDLLLTTKHIYPFYLTKTGSKQNQYLQYTTDYINNFKGCLRPNLSINNLVPFLNNLDYSFTSPTQIDDLLNSKELNEVDYFYGNNDGIDKRDMENYACYVKSMLKTNYIKNLIIDKKHQISNNFTLYIGNNVFRYPSFGYLSKQYLLTELYYDKTDQNCINGYQLSCSLIKGSSLSNEIIFDDPVIDGWRRLITRGCIGTPFPSGIMEVESFACAYIDISAIYTDFTSQNNSILNLTFVSKKDNDVVVFYSMFHKENSQIPSQFKGVFNDSFFGQYEIKENDSKRYFSLFHYLYFDIVKNGVDVSYNDANILVKEYDTLRKKLIEAIDALTIIDKEKLCNESNFNDYLHYHEQNITLNQIGNEYDDYYFVISPVVIPYTSFNRETYTFVTEKCSSKIIMYSLAIVKRGIVSNSDSIYNLFIYKSSRSLFFFVFLTIVCTTLFYLIIYYYLSALFEPIKLLKSIFYSVIKKIKKNIKKKEDRKKENEQTEDKKEEKIKKRQNELKLFKNIETKEISKTFKLFSQILLLSKKKELSKNFHVKSQLYNKFYQNLKNEHLKQKCELLIGFFDLKKQNYSKASEIFLNLIQKLEFDEKNLLKKNPNLEENIFNLPLQIVDGTKYINDYSKDIVFTRASNTFVNLKILLQKTYYFLGLSKYHEFITIKKRFKQRLKDEFENKEKDDSLTIEEKEKLLKEKKIKTEKVRTKIKLPENILLLDQAISNLTKSLEINKIMKINPIKSIFIQILLSKCYYQMEEIQTSAKYLKDALISLTQLDQILFDSAPVNILSIENDLSQNNKNYPNERILLIANSIMMEHILYNISKICLKKNKKYVATYILSRLLELNYYISDKIQNKASKNLYKILQKKYESKSINKTMLIENEIINIIYKRTLKNRVNKAIGIIISENITKNDLVSLISDQVIIKEIITKFDNEDFIALIDSKKDTYISIELNKKEDFLKMYSKLENTLPHTFKQSIYFYKKIIDDMGNKNIDKYDKILCVFIQIDEFFSKAQYKDQLDFIEALNKNNVGLYLFCFGNITKEQYDVLYYILKRLREGLLIHVKNLNLIKIAFENISRLKPTTLINFNLNNYDYIFSGKNILSQ